ncbi:type VII toxin-antitoxin system MntA family adenylyltransferase antitoxin [Virgibacillus sp. FSP13]
MRLNVEQTIIDLLREKVSPFLIILFGSTVNGTAHRESDIDIAFLNDSTELDAYDLFIVAQELAATLHQDVDLIDLNKASTVFQAQIIDTGKVIYCTDELKKAKYTMKTLKMYAKLNEERAEILQKVNESGSVYGK